MGGVGAGQTFPGDSRVRRGFLGDKDGSGRTGQREEAGGMKRRVKTAPDRNGSTGVGAFGGRTLQKAEGFEFMEKCNSLPLLVWPLWPQRGDWIGDMDIFGSCYQLQQISPGER